MEPTQFPRRHFLAGAALAAASVTLSGCGNIFGSNGQPGQPAPSGGGTTGGKQGGTLTVQVINFPHIDPQSVSFGMWLLQMGLLEGLVLQTVDGKDIRPGMAEKWDVSSDGLKYTFHLRDAKWSNGDPVTAKDFVWSYERLLNPNRGTAGATTNATSYQAALGIKNATAYNASTVKDFNEVGVKATDDKTLEFTLANPNPGFLFGLTFPAMLPLNPKAVGTGSDWQKPEKWVGNGPFNLAAWVPNSSMKLVKNPQYWDAGNVKLDTVNVQLIEQGSVTTTVPYESKEVDIQALGQAADVKRFKADAELSKQIHLVEDAQSGYLAPLMSKNKILLDKKVRQAISLGIGREEVAGIDPLSKPASTLISPATPGWSDDMAAFKPMYGDAAVQQGKKLLAEAGYPDGKGFPTLTILAGAAFPLIDVIIERLKTNLGITVKKDIVEIGVYVERRFKLHEPDYVGFWYGSFSGPVIWPQQAITMWNTDMTLQHSLPPEAYDEFTKTKADKTLSAADKSKKTREILDTKSSADAQAYAKKIAEVGTTVDVAKQTEIMKEAVKIREQAHIFIPTIWNSLAFVAQPRVQGFVPRIQADRYYFKDISVSN